jgi:hypothetical protein
MGCDMYDTLPAEELLNPAEKIHVELSDGKSTALTIALTHSSLADTLCETIPNQDTLRYMPRYKLPTELDGAYTQQENITRTPV